MTESILYRKLSEPAPLSVDAAMKAATPVVALFPFAGCSHHCSYCAASEILHDKTEKDKGLLLDQIGAREYLAALLRMLKSRSRILMAGHGEPAEHLDFEYMVRGLLDAGHEVTVLSHGLSSATTAKTLAPYSKAFIADRVEIYLSFHYGIYKEERGGRRLEAYLTEHFPRLAALGARLRVAVPLTPSVLVDPAFPLHLDTLRLLCDEHGTGFLFNPFLLNGRFKGKQYPTDYTDNEVNRVSEYIASSPEGTYGFISASTVRDYGWLTVRGHRCYGFRSMWTVDHKGNVSPCNFSSPGLIIGNIANSDLSFPPGECHAVPCPFDRCGCPTYGVSHCLIPHGVTYEEYLAERGSRDQVLQPV